MGRAEAAAASLHVEVAYSPGPGRTERVSLELPAGSTLRDALAASAPAQQAAASGAVGIWGRVQPPDTPLREGDRIEVYRPLTVDPKEARRLRYKRHRAARA